MPPRALNGLLTLAIHRPEEQREQNQHPAWSLTSAKRVSRLVHDGSRAGIRGETERPGVTVKIDFEDVAIRMAASPMSDAIGGRQFVAISGGSTVYAFAPSEAGR